MSLHSLTCPRCLTELLAEFTDSVGGLVQNNIQFVDPVTLRPLKPTESAANGGAVAPVVDHPNVAAATTAALAHADALGVDITQVEGTGKPVEVPVVSTEEVPTITKADVTAHAEANPPELDEQGNPVAPVNPQVVE